MLLTGKPRTAQGKGKMVEKYKFTLFYCKFLNFMLRSSKNQSLKLGPNQFCDIINLDLTRVAENMPVSTLMEIDLGLRYFYLYFDGEFFSFRVLQYYELMTNLGKNDKQFWNFSSFIVCMNTSE